MLVRAKNSFAGAFSMYKGQIMECSDESILHDLLNCEYIEEVQQDGSTATTLKVKGGKKNEGKRSNSN